MISFRQRALLLAFAWGMAFVAILVTTSPDAGFLSDGWLLMVPYFPVGLIIIFAVLPMTGNPTDVLIAGWVIYVALMIGALRAREKSRFCIFYSIIAALLLTNVAGCHMALSGNYH